MIPKGSFVPLSLSIGLNTLQGPVHRSTSGETQLAELDMRERLTNDMKQAMRSGDKTALSTLRLINAAIKDRDIAARVDAQGQSTGKEKIDEQEILALLQKMIKQRRDSVESYTKGGRADLAEKEQAEIAIIETYLPQQMSPEDTEKAVTAVIEELGAKSLQDMGRTMAALKEKYTGQMDFGKASGMVKAKLK
jgi:uncharacterized protein